MKYRKKPVIIDAFQFDGDFMNKDRIYYIPDWAVDMVHKGYIKYKSYAKGELEIKTLEGVMIASVGDYIIKGVNGEVYPCKPDIFEKTYEEAQLCTKGSLDKVIRTEADIVRVAKELNQELEKALEEDPIPKFPMRLDDVKLGFDFSCDTKREIKMLWNGHEVENIKNMALNIPDGEIPTMTVEVYLDTLNKDMFNKKDRR